MQYRISTLLIAIALAAILVSGLLIFRAARGEAERSEVSNASIEFDYTQEQDLLKAQDLLRRLDSEGQHKELFNTIFLPEQDLISCKVHRFDQLPELELYSFYQNKTGSKSVPIPQDQCVAAQLLITKKSLKVLDFKIHRGSCSFVETWESDAEGSKTGKRFWMIGWRSSTGEDINFRVSDEGFTPL